VILALGTALAHHIPVALSYVAGSEIVDEVVYYRQAANVGIPAYLHGGEVIEHHAPMQLQPGDFFVVRGADGATDVIELVEGDFRDFGDVALEEFLSLIGTKTNLAEVAHDNGYVVFRGTQGGPQASVELEDGTGAPLAQLGYGASTRRNGALHLVMEISIPADDHDEHETGGEDLPFAGLPYVVLASRTAGVSEYMGAEIPLAQDALTARFLQWTEQGRLPRFEGWLDEGQDAQAVLPAAILQQVLGGGAPDKLYFAVVVLSEDLQAVEYVSNLFTVDIAE
jgi:hypothetical protein